MKIKKKIPEVLQSHKVRDENIKGKEKRLPLKMKLRTLKAVSEDWLNQFL